MKGFGELEIYLRRLECQTHSGLDWAAFCETRLTQNTNWSVSNNNYYQPGRDIIALCSLLRKLGLSYLHMQHLFNFILLSYNANNWFDKQ